MHILNIECDVVDMSRVDSAFETLYYPLRNTNAHHFLVLLVLYNNRDGHV
jgi:hypothetical protein